MLTGVGLGAEGVPGEAGVLGRRFPLARGSWHGLALMTLWAFRCRTTRTSPHSVSGREEARAEEAVAFVCGWWEGRTRHSPLVSVCAQCGYGVDVGDDHHGLPHEAITEW